MKRVAVIVHERLGNWAIQLRSRLPERSIRWYETRSLSDVCGVLTGLASPVILLDPGSQVVGGLGVLAEISSRCPGAYTLFLDPESGEGVAELARELGATHVISGYVPPPEVAGIIDRWVGLVAGASGATEWSRRLTSSNPFGPDDWLEAVLPREPEDDGNLDAAAALAVLEAQA